MRTNLFLIPFIVLAVASCSQVERTVIATKEKLFSSEKSSSPTVAPKHDEASHSHGHDHDHGEHTQKLNEALAAAGEEESNQAKKPGFTFEEKQKMIAAFCKKTDASFKKYKWGKSDCSKLAWNFVRTSVKGDPLIWRTYGSATTKNEKGEEVAAETTLIMCGVHGDEITPIKFCYDVIDYLEKVNRGEVTDVHTGKLASLNGKRVVVAPIVNPDSYFKRRPTRTNANGVDVNRNFPTKDFTKAAMKTWIKRYRRDKRRFPGKTAMSEPETIFQVNLIYRYKPNKIISVHAPLSMLDYDGPASEQMGGPVGSRANQLLIRMSEQAKGYRIKNFPFYTGSLGNYAGNERNIPTFTLELPTSNPAKSKAYWNLFKDSIHSAVMHEIKGERVALEQEEAPVDTRSN